MGELDDLAREAAGTLQDRPTGERGLWLSIGSGYTVTKREHLAGIAAALAGAGALPRLVVRALPDPAVCGHASCRRRRGEPSLAGGSRPARVPAPRAALPEPQLTLPEVMDRHPLLGYYGFGAFDAHRKTTEERLQEIQTGRDGLRASEDHVLQVRDWLRANIAPIKTPTTGSYGLKHTAEKALGEYVSNGELIAAALMVGYSWKYLGGPNALFGMSKRDVDQARKTT